MMNYYEIKNKLINIFGEDTLKKYPISMKILDVYVKGLIGGIGQDKKDLKSIYFLPENGGIKTRIISVIFFLVSKFFKFKNSKILISPNLINVFPQFVNDLKKVEKISSFVTKRNAHFSYNSKITSNLDINNIVYPNEYKKVMLETLEILDDYIFNPSSINLKKSLHSNLDLLEKQLTFIISRLSVALINTNLKCFITCWDSLYEDIVMVLACKEANIESKVILHGYPVGGIKNQPLVGVFPINGDKLYVWNEHIRNILNDKDQINKILVGGYPKYSIEYINKMLKRYKTENTIIFFSSPPLFNLNKEEEFKLRENLFRELKNLADKNECNIFIRYHHQEKNRIEEERKILKKCNIKISKGPLIKDLLRCKLALGIQTSCLYEAKIIGKPVFSIYWPKVDAYYDDIKIININEISKIDMLNSNEIIKSEFYNMNFILNS